MDKEIFELVNDLFEQVMDIKVMVQRLLDERGV
jgi:hypothetical protein